MIKYYRSDSKNYDTCNMIECHNWDDDDWEPFGIYCSKCGEFVLDWQSRSKNVVDELDMPLPDYCPNCHAKVIGFIKE